MPLNYILLYTTTYTNNSLMINFNINPPLSQGISRTRPWCHASQHETWPVSCLQGLQYLQGITCPGSTLVPPHLFPAFGSRHGPPGKSIVDRWPGHLTDLWIFIVYIYIYMMYEIALSYLNRMSLYVLILSSMESMAESLAKVISSPASASAAAGAHQPDHPAGPETASSHIVTSDPKM